MHLSYIQRGLARGVNRVSLMHTWWLCAFNRGIEGSPVTRRRRNTLRFTPSPPPLSLFALLQTFTAALMEFKISWKVLHKHYYDWQVFFSRLDNPSGPRRLLWGFSITLRHTTIGRTPLDEWSARHTDLYLTTHNSHKRQTSIPPPGFEPAIPASELPQGHAFDSAELVDRPIPGEHLVRSEGKRHLEGANVVESGNKFYNKKHVESCGSPWVPVVNMWSHVAQHRFPWWICGVLWLSIGSCGEYVESRGSA
jgi:hypothetical protein